MDSPPERRRTYRRLEGKWRPPSARRRPSFDDLVRRAAKELPEEFARRLENVDIIVRRRPSPAQLQAMQLGAGHTLLGLYVGTDLAQRGSGYTFALPDRIFIYREPIERLARDDEHLVAIVRHTVLHELAHHFGISDARLREIGRY